MRTALLFAVLALLIGWYLVRRHQARQMARAIKADECARPKKTAFHAVTIHSSASACAAAKAQTGRRFLASDAPEIPLKDCDVHDCQCRFAHHDDRRRAKDRRSAFGSGGMTAGTGSFDVERRSGQDRRKKVNPDRLQ